MAPGRSQPSFLFWSHRSPSFAVGSGLGGGGGVQGLGPPAARWVRAIADLAAEVEQMLHQGGVSRWASSGKVVLNSTTKEAAFRLAKASRKFINDCRISRRYSKREVATNPRLGLQAWATPRWAEGHGLVLLDGRWKGSREVDQGGGGRTSPEWCAAGQSVGQWQIERKTTASCNLPE